MTEQCKSTYGKIITSIWPGLLTHSYVEHCLLDITSYMIVPCY